MAAVQNRGLVAAYARTSVESFSVLPTSDRSTGRSRILRSNANLVSAELAPPRLEKIVPEWRQLSSGPGDAAPPP